MHNSVRILCAVVSRPSIQELQQHVYEKLALHFSLAPRARIGLAISGGVDSMGLATICRDFKKKHNQYAFTGFVVDHGVRPGSAEEAMKVTTELKTFGIDAETLKLDWNEHGDPKCLPNFETIARRLRYQALGKACYRQRITRILTAHHKDDLAETVLSRMVAGYLGEGLQGIKPTAAIPECQGIYGVDASGTPRMEQLKPGSRGFPIESGGVFLERPLLAFTKDDLIEICHRNKVRWFEDSTNADKTLTVRNTIRHLHTSGGLPAALDRPRLVTLAQILRQKHNLYEDTATKIWSSTHIQLHPATGTAEFSLPQDCAFDNMEETQSYHIKALLTRRLLTLVSPLQTISLQDLDAAIDIFFATPDVREAKLQTQGVTVHCNSQSTPYLFLIQRQNPTRNTTIHSTALSTLQPIFAVSSPHNRQERKMTSTHATNWTLWDNRYWIRILYRPSSPTSPPPSSFHFSIRFLSPATTHHLRAAVASDSAASQALRKALRTAGTTRLTQPVISVRVQGDDEKKGAIKGEMILGLPALGWKREEVMEEMGVEWEVRYKAVDFVESERHSIVWSSE